MHFGIATVLVLSLGAISMTAVQILNAPAQQRSSHECPEPPYYAGLALITMIGVASLNLTVLSDKTAFQHRHPQPLQSQSHQQLPGNTSEQQQEESAKAEVAHWERLAIVHALLLLAAITLGVFTTYTLLAFAPPKPSVLQHLSGAAQQQATTAGALHPPASHTVPSFQTTTACNPASAPASPDGCSAFGEGTCNVTSLELTLQMYKDRVSALETMLDMIATVAKYHGGGGGGGGDVHHSEYQQKQQQHQYQQGKYQQVQQHQEKQHELRCLLTQPKYQQEQQKCQQDQQGMSSMVLLPT
jgi:hypothetical protein